MSGVGPEEEFDFNRVGNADRQLRRAGPGLAAAADRGPGPPFGPREGHRPKRRAQADRGAFLGPGPFLRVQKWPWPGVGREGPRR